MMKIQSVLKHWQINSKYNIQNIEIKAHAFGEMGFNLYLKEKGDVVSDFYKTINVTEDVYRISSVENVFCELLVGKDKALLIDTGFAFGDLKSVVKKITNKPLIIVNTHGHVDHTCGNCQFEEVIHISEKDMNLCEEHNSSIMRAHSAALAEHTMNYETGKEVYGLPGEFDLEEYQKGGTGKLVACKEGETFDLGGMTIEVIETPGHTKGGLSFLYKEENWLYAGDEVNGFCWLFDKNATDRETHIQSLKKIRNLNPIRIFGGHMPEAMTVKEVDRFIQIAKVADFSKGIPFQSPILQGYDARICMLEDCSMADMGSLKMASIVIDETR